MMMSVIEWIKTRRSCRTYTEGLVTAAQQEVLECAFLWAPTSKNSRPWSSVWVTDRLMLEQLSRCKPQGAAFVAQAPLAVVILADPQKSDVWIEDTAVAASYLQLTAESLGLGSCWVQVRLRLHEDGSAASDYVKKVLGIPDSLEVASIVTIGIKARERQPNTDEMLMRDRIYHERFGQ